MGVGMTRRMGHARSGLDSGVFDGPRPLSLRVFLSLCPKTPLTPRRDPEISLLCSTRVSQSTGLLGQKKKGEEGVGKGKG